jgi:hypothetical protein
LNEPRWDVPLDILKRFYIEAYRRVREHVSSEKGAVVMHDAFRQLQWADFMHGPDYANVILDTHPLINFDAAPGWFFWTFKTDEGGAWSFRDCVQRGWMPEKYQ